MPMVGNLLVENGPRKMLKNVKVQGHIQKPTQF